MLDPDGDDFFTDNQYETFDEFERTLYEYLIENVDRRGYEHGLTPAGGTRMYEINGPEDPVTSKSVLDNESSTNMCEGTNRNLISMVSDMGMVYLSSYQGFDDTGDDGGLHSTLRMIQAGKITAMDSIERSHRALDYSMTQMSTGDKYPQMMGIAAPKGQLCCDYSTKRIREDVGDDKHSMISRLIFDCEILFPMPIDRQGRPFYKGLDYLIAAFHYAELQEAAIVENLATLTAEVNQQLEQEADLAMRDPEVSSKRRELFRSFGMTLEHVCPIM